MAEVQRIVLRGPLQKERALALLESVPCDERRPIAMVLEPYDEDHTRAQQKLYRACVGAAAKEIGYAPDELHELLLAKHFGTKEVRLGDTRVTMVLRRTTSNEKGERDPLKKKRMSAYYEWAMAFLADEMGIRV
jgi:hypothetical protein